MRLLEAGRSIGTLPRETWRRAREIALEQDRRVVDVVADAIEAYAAQGEPKRIVDAYAEGRVRETAGVDA